MNQLLYFAVIAVGFGIGTLLLGLNRRTFLSGLIVFTLAVLWILLYPLVFGLSQATPLKDVWEIVHVLGIVVGGMCIVYMKVREHNKGESYSLGLMWSVALTLVWVFGMGLLRKILHIKVKTESCKRTPPSRSNSGGRHPFVHYLSFLRSA